MTIGPLILQKNNIPAPGPSTVRILDDTALQPTLAPTIPKPPPLTDSPPLSFLSSLSFPSSITDHDPIPTPPLLVTPHPRAPLFNGSDSMSVLSELEEEIATGNFPTNEVFIDIIRQASLVSLFFFLRYVASYAGPYGLLKRTLHAEMCNFRQACMRTGCHGAMFVPRSTFKSTINTSGYSTWRLSRDNDATIGIVASLEDRSKEFFLAARTIIDSNSLYQELFPENVPIGRADWNDNYFSLPSRSMRKSAPSLSYMTAMGSTGGIHVGEMIFDDLVTDKMLDSQRRATAEMIKVGNWISTNKATLLEDPVHGMIFLSGTRYAINDPYESVMLDSCEHAGNWSNVEEQYKVKPNGEWNTYYRSAKDLEGRSIFPEKYPNSFLDKLEEEDSWTYNLQYINFPIGIESIEFAQYRMREIEVTWSDKYGWVIRIVNDDELVLVSECDVGIAIDPAGSDKYVSMKTSKTSLVVLAVDSKKRKFILEAMAGYVPATKWFDWMFDTANKYQPYLARTIVEQQAGFKALESLIRKEQYERGASLRYRPIPALGDKDVTIRNIIQPELDRGLMYCNVRCYKAVWEEMKAFPMSPKKDILDALKILIKFSVTPDAGGSGILDMNNEDLQSLVERCNSVTGY